MKYWVSYFTIARGSEGFAEKEVTGDAVVTTELRITETDVETVRGQVRSIIEKGGTKPLQDVVITSIFQLAEDR